MGTGIEDFLGGSGFEDFLTSMYKYKTITKPAIDPTRSSYLFQIAEQRRRASNRVPEEGGLRAEVHGAFPDCCPQCASVPGFLHP